MKTFILVLAAYLIGSISPSILLGRMQGIDIRTKGSGNAGTTNVLRTMGKKSALITLILDVAKGFIAVRLGALGGPVCCYLCAVFVIIGHIFPCYFGFKGGKGVAAALGALLGVNWKIALICLAVTLVMVLLFKMVSLGSVTGAAALPLISLFLEKAFAPFALVMALLIIIKHKANLKRIIKGEESKLSFKK